MAASMLCAFLNSNHFKKKLIFMGNLLTTFIVQTRSITFSSHMSFMYALQLLTLLLLCAVSQPAQAFINVEQEHEKLPLYSKVYDDTRNPFHDAQAALTLAKKMNKNVLINIGGNWCGWCKKMDAFLKSQPDVYHALHKNFVVLKVNVSDSNENTEFMQSLPPVKGYPHIYISSFQGQMLVSKDTAELYVNDAYSKAQWLTFISKWKIKS